MTKMTRLMVSAGAGRLVLGSLALVLAGALAGCGGSAQDGPTGAAPTGSGMSSSSTSSGSTSPSSSSSSSAGRTLTITVQGKKVTPAPATIDLTVGTMLTLVVTSDHDDELHLHGFDVEKVLKAGQPTSVTVTGKEPGVYEVETHEPPLRLLKIAVR